MRTLTPRKSRQRRVAQAKADANIERVANALDVAAPARRPIAAREPAGPPAFIDDPPASASLTDWQTYAANLRKVEADGVPRLGPMIAFAKREARRVYMREYYLKHREAKLAERRERYARERRRKARAQGEGEANPDRQGTLIDGR
jgi:hypothetical protein